MPTYSYACTECGDEFDIVQSMTEESLTQCPKCTGRLRKLFGNVGVMFKGSGFYRTDSRSGSSGSGDGSGSSNTGSSNTSTPAASGSTSSGGSTSGGSTSGSTSGSSGSSGSSGGSTSAA